MLQPPAQPLRFVVVVVVVGVLCTSARLVAQPLAAQPAPTQAAAPQPTAAPVAAAPAVQATIVHIDGEDIVIDVGAGNLAGATRLTVYRTLEVRHPLTHKALRDRFVIGVLSVVQTGARLSVAKVEGTPAHPLAVGDTVELAVRPQALSALATVAPAGQATSQATPYDQSTASAQTESAAASSGASAATTAAAPAVRPLDVEERELLAYWYATLSKAPAERVRLYNGFLQRHPDSRYRPFIQTEINYLHSAETPAHAALAGKPAVLAPHTRVEMRALQHAEEGQAVELAALAHTQPGFRSLLVHVRPIADNAVYQTLLADIDERGHARVQVPASLVRAPGFEYFVESVDTQGHSEQGVASAQGPQQVSVQSKSTPARPSAPSTRVHYTSEMVSFDNLSGRDWFLLNEGDFLYRVRYHELYAVRLGYGNYRGEGGTVDQLDRLRLSPRPAGFTYGFLETLFELHRLFGLALRGTVGLGRPNDPNEERNGITGGFQLRARLGSAEGTHLELAGELLPEIGQRAYIGLHWEAIDRFPMATEIVVTDQPVHSDELAVRLIYECGYRITDRIAVALRPSYQLRTIRHAGPGIGFSTTFDW